MAPHNPPKTVLIIGANGYIGHAVALAFVRAGYKTYGLVRQASFLSILASEEIIPLLGSPASPTFLPTLEEEGVVFDVLVSTTEQILDYFPHYNDVVKLLRGLAKRSLEKKGVKPLVLFTSGCKDYGMTPLLADSPGLAPHTEDSPLNPPPVLIDRAKGTLKIFENADVFDAIALRPTNVYGGNSSYYGLFFVAAEQAKERGYLEASEEPLTVLNAMHVDDCAEAYVALAEHPDRSVVKGQVYNISAEKYETLDEILRSLVREYGVEGGVRYVNIEARESIMVDRDRMLMGFSQVSSFALGKLLFEEGAVSGLLKYSDRSHANLMGSGLGVRS